MGETKSNGFKRAFQKKFGSAEANFTLRAGKVEAALGEMDKWVQHMETQGDARGQTARARSDALWVSLRSEKQKAATGNNQQVKQAFAALEQIKDDARAALKQGRIDAKKTPAAVDPLGDGQQVKVFMSDIPGFQDMTDPEKDFFQKQVGAKMLAGKTAFDDLQTMSDDQFDALPPPDAKAITDLAWYIKSKAQEKVSEPFERGALTVPDPDGRLAKYMKKSQDGYNRGSSHLPDQQAGPRGQGWGIDFYEGVDDGKPAAGQADSLLPSGMRTILIQEVSTNSEKRLYIKMETESARLDAVAPLRARADKKRGVVRDNPQSRAFLLVDIPRSIEHGNNLIKSKLHLSQGDDKELTGFREQVDKRLKALYGDLCKMAAARNPTVGKMLKNGQGHVFQMFEALLLTLKRPELMDDELLQAISKCATEMNAILVAISYDADLENRFGNEVALSKDDLAPPVPPVQVQQPPPQPVQGAQPVPGNAPATVPGGAGAPPPQRARARVVMGRTNSAPDLRQADKA